MSAAEDKYLRLRDENTALKRENNELRVVIKRYASRGGGGAVVWVPSLRPCPFTFESRPCPPSMKTKLAIIEEKAAKLQSGWNASHSSQRRSVLGVTTDTSPSKSADKLRMPAVPPRPGDGGPDKVAALHRIIRDKNAEIEDLQVSGWVGAGALSGR